MGEYGAFYGTIGFQLEQIIAGLEAHSYAIVPEYFYREWKRFADFRDERESSYFGTDSNEHWISIAKFESEGHTWSVTTAKCPHPSNLQEFSWRYIVKIMKDGAVVSRPKTRFEDYLHYVNHAK